MQEFRILTSQQLALHLRSLREVLGLTQAQLGLRLGVEQARVAKIERNPGSVSFDQLLKVLAALETDVVLSRRTKAPRRSRKAHVEW